MKCRHLNLFRLSRLEWSVTSCLANDRPYTPSLSELNDYCKSEGYQKCPVLLKMHCSGSDTPCPEVAFAGRKL